MKVEGGGWIWMLMRRKGVRRDVELEVERGGERKCCNADKEMRGRN